MKDLTQESRSNTAPASVSFAAQDAKGRKMGALIQTFTSTFEAKDAGATWGSTRAPGSYFGAWVQASKDGKHWGSSQAERYFPTAAERDAFVARRLRDMEKSALKQGGVK